mmetsp:Transcript_51881/g.121349  ORF Transcript_51881/g.121349 Transcript_51881/m.121349 type:complete len:997 (+) Transcript_51881:33-3023(+)
MVPLLPAPTARQPSGAAATQAAADLQGLTASIKQTERLLHELCITHQVPIALEDSRVGTKGEGTEPNDTQTSFAKQELAQRADAQVMNIMQRTHQKSEAKRHALAQLAKAKESKEQKAAKAKASPQDEEHGSGDTDEDDDSSDQESIGAELSSDNDVEFDAKTWRMGVEALLAKIEAQSEWATAATLRQHFRQQTAAQRQQRLGAVDDLEAEHKESVLNFSHATHTMDRALNESQMKLFSKLGDFNNNLHVRTMKAVQARDKRLAEERRSRALDTLFDPAKAVKVEKHEKEATPTAQAPVQAKRQVSEAADLMGIISDQQNRIASLEAKSRIVQSQAQVHVDAATYLEYLASQEHEGHANQPLPPEPAVEEILSEFVGNDTVTRRRISRASNRRGSVMGRVNSEVDSKKFRGAESETAGLEKEVEYLKVKMQELQRGMEHLMPPSSPKSAGLSESPASGLTPPLSKMSRRDRLAHLEKQSAETASAKVEVAELEQKQRSLEASISSAQGSLDRMTQDKTDFFASVSKVSDVAASFSALVAHANQEYGTWRQASSSTDAKGALQSEPSSMLTVPAARGQVATSMQRSLPSELQAEEVAPMSNDFVDWNIMDSKLVQAFGRRAHQTFEEGEALLRRLREEEADLLQKIGQATQETNTARSSKTLSQASRAGGGPAPGSEPSKAEQHAEGSPRMAAASNHRRLMSTQAPVVEDDENKTRSRLRTSSSIDAKAPSLAAAIPTDASRSLAVSVGPSSVGIEQNSPTSLEPPHGQDAVEDVPHRGKRAAMTVRPVINGDKILHPGFGQSDGANPQETEMLQRLLQLQDENMFLTDQIRRYDEKAHAVRRGQPVITTEASRDLSMALREEDSADQELNAAKTKLKRLQRTLMKKRKKWQDLEGSGLQRRSSFRASSTDAAAPLETPALPKVLPLSVDAPPASAEAAVANQSPGGLAGDDIGKVRQRKATQDSVGESSRLLLRRGSLEGSSIVRRASNKDESAT